MESKKRLIRKLAAAAALVILVGLALVLLTTVISSGARAERREEERLQRAQAVESARSYLEELAGRITTVPVDPTIVSEVQARYFEEVSEGRRFVWGMGADGDFLFGVPRETFARLNAVWNAHEAEILGEGTFVDRQDFLRQLVHAGEELELSDLEPGSDDPDDTPWAALRRRGDVSGWMVFSAPLKGEDGSALGNLYLKREDLEREWVPRSHGLAEGLGAAAAGVSAVAGLFLWFLLPTWVYVDARERGVRRALLWSFLVLISVFVGLVVYLIARPEETTLKCPGCEREVNGGAYCPHCGYDLSSAFCATCRYPLKADWVYCPSCRTEVGRSTKAGAPEGETLAETATRDEAAPEGS